LNYQHNLYIAEEYIVTNVTGLSSFV